MDKSKIDFKGTINKDGLINDHNDDDDDIKLSEDTLKILNEFLAEKMEKERLEEAYLEGINRKDATFEENWQLSQFWYNEKTIKDLTAICKRLLKDDSNIALLSCPSLYSSIKNIHNKVKIFEYDKRFKSFGDDFVYYDFNKANSQYLIEYHNTFDIIVVDPPFLSEECIEKMSIIVKNFKKFDGNDTKIMFCSGLIVENFIKNYLNLFKTNYTPEHQKNLGNDFILYTNFDINS